MPAGRVPPRSLAPRKLAKQARSEATVEAIIQAGAQVFERHGYAAASTNRIAERAGVSIGSLYQYYPNKDAILLELARRHVADSTAQLAPHLERLNRGARWDEVLPGLVCAMVAMHAVAPRLHRSLFEETPLPKPLREELQQLEDALVEQTAKALAADPEWAPAHPRLAASVVVNAIEGLTHRLVLRAPDGVRSEAIAAEITTLVRSYVNASRNHAGER
jgi:AcrR family transcriptional regulator